MPVRRGTPVPACPDSAPSRPGPFFGPFGEFDELWDRLVNRFFAPQTWAWPQGWAGWSQGWTPPVDVEQTDNAWIFEVELPGTRPGRRAGGDQ